MCSPRQRPIVIGDEGGEAGRGEQHADRPLVVTALAALVVGFDFGDRVVERRDGGRPTGRSRRDPAIPGAVARVDRKTTALDGWLAVTACVHPVRRLDGRAMRRPHAARWSRLRV